MALEREPHDAAWLVAFDERGNDLALEAQLAAMSDEERDRTEQNVRAFVEKVRPTLRSRSR